MSKQPATAFSCSEGGTPWYDGNACDAEEAAADQCLDAQLPEPSPNCLRFCDLDADVCGHDNVEVCREASCRGIWLIPECADEYERWYDCLAALQPTALVCNTEMLQAADGSCNDERATIEQCFASM